MSNDALRSVCGPAAIPGWPALPPLCASTIDTALVSNNMEYELRALVMQHRRVSHTYRLNLLILASVTQQNCKMLPYWSFKRVAITIFLKIYSVLKNGHYSYCLENNARFGKSGVQFYVYIRLRIKGSAQCGMIILVTC